MAGKNFNDFNFIEKSSYSRTTSGNDAKELVTVFILQETIKNGTIPDIDKIRKMLYQKDKKAFYTFSKFYYDIGVQLASEIMNTGIPQGASTATLDRNSKIQSTIKSKFNETKKFIKNKVGFDIWSPPDIWIITPKGNAEIKKLEKTAFNDEGGYNRLTYFMAKNFNTRDIIGISLKNRSDGKPVKATIIDYVGSNMPEIIKAKPIPITLDITAGTFVARSDSNIDISTGGGSYTQIKKIGSVGWEMKDSKANFKVGSYSGWMNKIGYKKINKAKSKLYIEAPGYSIPRISEKVYEDVMKIGRRHSKFINNSSNSVLNVKYQDFFIDGEFYEPKWKNFCKKITVYCFILDNWDDMFYYNQVMGGKLSYKTHSHLVVK